MIRERKAYVRRCDIPDCSAEHVDLSDAYGDPSTVPATWRSLRFQDRWLHLCPAHGLHADVLRLIASLKEQRA